MGEGGGDSTRNIDENTRFFVVDGETKAGGAESMVGEFVDLRYLDYVCIEGPRSDRRRRSSNQTK